MILHIPATTIYTVYRCGECRLIMAATTLSDADIERLLNEAEGRLKEKAASVTTSSAAAISVDSKEPKARKSYVCTFSCRRHLLT